MSYVKLILTLNLLLFTACTDTGGKISGWVSDALERSSLSSGSMTLTVNEGSTLGIVLILDRPVKEDADLNWSIHGPLTKFQSTSGVLRLNKGEQTKVLQINTLHDPISDGTKSYTLDLSGSFTVFANTLQLELVLLDLDSLPVLTMADVSQAEGNSGTTNMPFTVTLSAVSGVDVVVNYATSSSTGVGKATAGTDYTATSGTLTIPAGNTTGTINVPILGDTVYEPDEVFTMTLSGGSGYTTTGSTLTATGTITNDDAKVYTWDFSSTSLMPSGFTYDSNFISYTSGSAPQLKVADTQTSTAMDLGTHSGTKVDSGVLTLDTATPVSKSLREIVSAKDANLLYYYRTENSWADSSSTGNFPATVYLPGTSGGFTSGKIGTYAANFNGSSDRYEVSGTNTQSFYSYTWTLWVNVRAFGSSNMRLVSAQGTYYWMMYLTNAGILAEVDSPNSGGYTGPLTVDAADAIAPGQWYMVTVVRDTSVGKYRFYINGVLRKTYTSGTNVLNPGSNIAIGAYNAFSGSQYFNGAMDEIGLWNTYLTDAEVKAIYDAQKARYTGTFTSTVLDMGQSVVWPKLVAMTNVPAGKPLPTTSEDTSTYPGVVANLMADVYAIWHFDDGAGTSFADSTATGLTATANVSLTSDTNAMFRTGIKLTASASQCLTTATTDLGSSFTLAGWARTTVSTATSQTFIANAAQTSAANGFKFYVHTSGSSDGAVAFETGNGSTAATAKTGANVGTPSGWHHYLVAVNKTAGTAYIYVDGKLQNTSNSTVNTDFNSSAVLKIGCMANSTRYLDGSLDEWAIWKRELSATEALSLYRRGANRVKYQVRSCAASPCNESTETWKGPDGTSATYFSELYNYATVSNGVVSGAVNGGNLQVTLANFTSSPPFLANRPYFQYRVFLESDDVNGLCSGAPCLPKVISVGTSSGGRYYAGAPSFVNTTAVALSTALQQMSVSDATAGCTKYQVSVDDGVTWKYLLGSTWTTTSAGVANSNTMAEIAGKLTALGSGNFKFKAFFNTNASGDLTQSCQLNSVEIKYDGP